MAVGRWPGELFASSEQSAAPTFESLKIRSSDGNNDGGELEHEDDDEEGLAPSARRVELYGARGESLASEALKEDKLRAIASRRAESAAHRRRLGMARETRATTNAMREYVAREARMRLSRELDPAVVRRKAEDPDTGTTGISSSLTASYSSLTSSLSNLFSDGGRERRVGGRLERPAVPDDPGH